MPVGPPPPVWRARTSTTNPVEPAGPDGPPLCGQHKIDSGDALLEDQSDPTKRGGSDTLERRPETRASRHLGGAPPGATRTCSRQSSHTYSVPSAPVPNVRETYRHMCSGAAFAWFGSLSIAPAKQRGAATGRSCGEPWAHSMGSGCRALRLAWLVCQAAADVFGIRKPQAGRALPNKALALEVLPAVRNVCLLLRRIPKPTPVGVDPDALV